MKRGSEKSGCSWLYDGIVCVCVCVCLVAVSEQEASRPNYLPTRAVVRERSAVLIDIIVSLSLWLSLSLFQVLCEDLMFCMLLLETLETPIQEPDGFPSVVRAICRRNSSQNFLGPEMLLCAARGKNFSMND